MLLDINNLFMVLNLAIDVLIFLHIEESQINYLKWTLKEMLTSFFLKAYNVL